MSELARDALAEIVNIGVGQAAASLSAMINEEVALAVPTVEMIESGQINRLLAHLSGGKLTAVTQHFSGELNGQAILFFPQESSLNLVRALLKDDVPVGLLNDLEKEALMEVGNIILNACFGTVANVLKLDVSSSLPDLVQGRSDELLDQVDSVLLLINVNFHVKERAINGYVSFVMDVGQFELFQLSLQRYLHSMTPGAGA